MEDEAEASKIVEWLKREINAAWENRHAITPRYQGMPRPRMIQILRCLNDRQIHRLSFSGRPLRNRRIN